MAIQRFSILVMALMLFNLSAQEGVKAKKWELVWEDNFDFFDTTIWKVQDNFDHYGGRVLCSEKNVFAEDGNLVIQLVAENYSCPEWAIDPNWCCVNQYKTGEPYRYTSGMLESKAPYDTQYGHIEARIKFPHQKALFPAFWTLIGYSAKNPVNVAEIDIVEQLGELGTNTLTTNIHREYCTAERLTYAQGCPEIKSSYQEYTSKKYEWTNWHTYGIEWNAKKIKFYLDGKRIRTIKKHLIEDPVKLIFNMNIRPDEEVDETLLPQKMLVDYVRVHRQK